MLVDPLNTGVLGKYKVDVPEKRRRDKCWSSRSVSSGNLAVLETVSAEYIASIFRVDPVEVSSEVQRILAQDDLIARILHHPREMTRSPLE